MVPRAGLLNIYITLRPSLKIEKLYVLQHCTISNSCQYLPTLLLCLCLPRLYSLFPIKTHPKQAQVLTPTIDPHGEKNSCLRTCSMIEHTHIQILLTCVKGALANNWFCGDYLASSVARPPLIPLISLCHSTYVRRYNISSIKVPLESFLMLPKTWEESASSFS